MSRVYRKLTWDEWYSYAADYFKEHGTCVCLPITLHRTDTGLDIGSGNSGKRENPE